MKKETKQGFVFWLSIISAVVSAVGVFGIVAVEIYVRWKLNQNFTFLGTNELPALMLGVFVLMAMLLYTQRDNK